MRILCSLCLVFAASATWAGGLSHFRLKVGHYVAFHNGVDTGTTSNSITRVSSTWKTYGAQLFALTADGAVYFDELKFQSGNSDVGYRRFFVLKRAKDGMTEVILDEVTGRDATEMVSNGSPVWDGKRLIYLKQTASGDWLTGVSEQKTEAVYRDRIAVIQAPDGRLIVQTTVGTEESTDLVHWSPFRYLRYTFSEGEPRRFFRLEQ